MKKPTIGFIGLGNMGTPMAATLLRAGYPLRIYDINPDRYAPLVDLGAVPVSVAAEVALPGSIILMMVPNDQAIQQIVESDLLTRLGPNGLLVPLSTISPQTSEMLANRSAPFGVSYIAASVLGRPDRAALGKLIIFVSGKHSSKERILPLLTIWGTVEDLGEPLERANRIKLAFNAYLVGEMHLLAHLLPFVIEGGLDPIRFLITLQHFVENGTVIPVYGPMIASQCFQEEGQGFNLTLGEKDVRYYLEEAEQLAIPANLFEQIHLLMMDAQAQGLEAQSWAVFTQFLDGKQRTI